MEVAVVGIGIEVGDSRGEFDGREETLPLLGSNLLARARQGFGRGWRIVGGGSSAQIPRQGRGAVVWCVEHAIDGAVTSLPGKSGNLRVLWLTRTGTQDMVVSAAVVIYDC
ncbi:hypothetical protein NUW58_g8513 [Xylaria curta]|uniref:Uncharacterized protein n=1 Tax=Xylaria curta TaxID=42375 RepID=A0ACC1N8T0_9PEZI|nr:hypothetical protein NUW58_g8513 [Xylaria curta]